MSVLIVAFAVLMLIFGQYTRRIRVDGIVIPSTGISRVTSPQNGWISKQWVKDGDKVHLGQALYTLRLDNITSSGSSAETAVSLLREKRKILRADLHRQDAVNKEKKSALESAHESILLEEKQVEDQITLAVEQADVLNTMVEKQKANLKRGLAKDSDYEPRLQSFMSQQAQVEQLKRERAQIQTRLSDNSAQLASFDLNARSDTSKMKQDIIDTEQRLAESEALFEITLTAPRAGVVTAMLGYEGQTASIAAPLLTILPENDPLAAQLFVPSSAIGFIREGQRVLIRYDSFPYQKFGQYPGTVTSISKTTLSANDMRGSGLEVSNERLGDQMYRVTVRPDHAEVQAYAKQIPLQPGMKLEASVLTETRPLYQWILDPLYSLSATVSSAGQTKP